MNKPFFLLTNDDGIHAFGLQHLCDAVADFADIAIIAPNEERSGSGLCVSWHQPLHVQEYQWNLPSVQAWSVSGTPADCVKMGLSVLLTKKPDLILSGINSGSNAGATVLYSGTVGGTIEGALRGIPGIAFSFSDFTFPSLGCVRETVAHIVQHALDHPLKQGSILNVNFPRNCAEGTKGLRMARQGRGVWMENPRPHVRQEGTSSSWLLGGKWHHREEEDNSDVALLEKGYVTIAPIYVGEMTDHDAFSRHRELLERRKIASL